MVGGNCWGRCNASSPVGPVLSDGDGCAKDMQVEQLRLPEAAPLVQAFQARFAAAAAAAAACPTQGDVCVCVTG